METKSSFTLQCTKLYVRFAVYVTNVEKLQWIVEERRTFRSRVRWAFGHLRPRDSSL